MKIGHYNIFHAEDRRLEQVLGIIDEMNTDVCCLLEVEGKEDVIERMMNHTQKTHSYFYYTKANSRHNMAVISKTDVHAISILDGFTHAVVKTEILKDDTVVVIFFVHLSPYSEDERLAEIAKLMEYVKNTENVIIMGDINSLSLFDPYDHDELLQVFHKNGVIKYGENTLRFDVVHRLKQYGFTDAMQYLGLSFDFSTPTPFNTDTNHATELRIDCAYISKKLLPKLRGAYFVKNGLTDSSSDHYPLVIEFDA